MSLVQGSELRVDSFLGGRVGSSWGVGLWLEG